MYLNITTYKIMTWTSQLVARGEQMVKVDFYDRTLPQQKAGVPSSIGSEEEEDLIAVFGD